MKVQNQSTQYLLTYTRAEETLNTYTETYTDFNLLQERIAKLHLNRYVKNVYVEGK